jgi:hypothetical protein
MRYALEKRAEKTRKMAGSGDKKLATNALVLTRQTPGSTPIP